MPVLFAKVLTEALLFTSSYAAQKVLVFAHGRQSEATAYTLPGRQPWPARPGPDRKS